ncbi:hypothetical protein WG66_011252 [Moniliophthora roreri]|nr:hypothetical protein WG66_011252 [Moniliophthora roreri]
MTYQGNPNAKAINATTAIPDDNQISGRPSRLRRGRNMSFHNIFEVELDLQGMRDGQKASLLRRKGCGCADAEQTDYVMITIYSKSST